MRRPALAAACAALFLTGCLEVEQHPPWRQGEYDGKRDNLPQQAFFHGDRLAWMAAVINRNGLQDEYGRTLHKGAGHE
jgi:hypothetical protein